jgi:hypothetical protein
MRRLKLELLLDAVRQDEDRRPTGVDDEEPAVR